MTRNCEPCDASCPDSTHVHDGELHDPNPRLPMDVTPRDISRSAGVDPREMGTQTTKECPSCGGDAPMEFGTNVPDDAGPDADALELYECECGTSFEVLKHDDAPDEVSITND